MRARCGGALRPDPGRLCVAADRGSGPGLALAGGLLTRWRWRRMARIDVVMPQMGESIAEGTLSKWLKRVGDPVKRDEPMFEISTDKVDAEIPAPNGGVLAEILVKEGETVSVQTVVARIETDASAAATTAAPVAPAASPRPRPRPPAPPPPPPPAPPGAPPPPAPPCRSGARRSGGPTDTDPGCGPS